MRRSGLPILAIFVLFLAIPSIAAPQSSRNAKTAIEHAIESLATEAQQALRIEKLPTDEPEFADRRLGDIPLLQLQEALVHQQDKDPFVDAYIRWQLTSFKPDFPPLDDAQFARVLDAMPKFIENPRADKELLAFLDQFKQLDPNCGSLQPFGNHDIAELMRRGEVAEAFNKPAEEIFEWTKTRLASSPARQILVQIAHCQATIASGWPSRDVKTRMTKTMKSARTDPRISPADRQLIAERLKLLIGLERRSVNEITIKKGGQVETTFTTSAVFKHDVQKWIDTLNGD